MESALPSSFPANYVTLKDLQERWIKRKLDEVNEANLRKIQEQEKIKSLNEKKLKNEKPVRSTEKSVSSPTIQMTEEKKLTKSAKRRRSGRSRLPPTDTKSMVEISGKRKEEEGKGLEKKGGDRTAEVCCRVAGLSVSGGDDKRGGRVTVGGGYGRWGGGGRPAVTGPGKGMMWVRKTN